MSRVGEAAADGGCANLGLSGRHLEQAGGKDPVEQGNAMAIGWMTVLKLVPWADVVRNAPVIVDGAKKLWQSVGRKGARAGAGDPRDLVVDATPADPLHERLAQAQASIAELQDQMQASSALIKALAEQNTELIRRVETNRVRMLWLAGLVLVFGAIAALNLAVTLSR